MKLSQASRISKMLLKIHQNPLWVSRPGVGKTQTIKQLGEELGWDIQFMHPVISDPTDFKGMPAITPDGKAHFLPFGDLNRLIEADKPLLVLIDDVGQSAVSVQAALMQVLWERKINGYEISPHVRFILATNRAEDKAGVVGLIEPIKNRCALLHVDFELDDWTEWALDHEITNATLGFVRFRSEFLTSWKPQPKEIIASCTPRTVEIWDQLFRSDIAGEDVYEACKSIVGEAYANEFTEFLKVYMELPSKEDIYLNPDKAKLPKKGNMSANYAVGVMLARNLNDNTFEQSMKYMDRVGEREITIMMVKDGIRLNPSVEKSKEFIRFAVKNKEFISL